MAPAIGHDQSGVDTRQQHRAGGNVGANPPRSIFSLASLTVDVSADVKEHLISQYAGLYREATKGQDHALGDAEEEKAAAATAERHVNRIIARMKTAPSVTCCRVNTLLATVEEVVEELDEALLAWRSTSGAFDGESDDCPESSSSSSDSGGVRLETSDRSCSGDGTAPVFGRCDQVMRARVHDTLGDCVLVEARAQGRSIPLTATGPIASDDTRRNGGSKNESGRLDGMSFKRRKIRSDRGWPSTHRVVICDRLCGEAVLRGSNVFVRGILCADSGVRKGEEVAVYADVGGSTPVLRGLVLENYGGRCVFLGMGRAQTTRAEMFRLSEGLGIDMVSGCKVGPNLPSIPRSTLRGRALLQNLPSILVGHALGPLPGETVLDMCCAPGGKTSHIASMMGNVGFVVACDRSRKKVLAAKQMFIEMGATCIVPLALDSTKSVASDEKSRRSAQEVVLAASPSKRDGLPDIKGFYPESFDRILLDPPCSALGLRPKLLVNASLKDINKHACYQKRFARAAVKLLKVGGTLTYSTCTINATENEQMVRHILDENPAMKLVPIDFDIGLGGLPGLGLSERERRFVRRFDPSCVTDTMGFFVAKFVKQ